MNNTLKIGVGLVVGAIALMVVWGLLKSAIGLLVPLAIIGGIGLIAFSFINRKAIGGGKRYLP